MPEQITDQPPPQPSDGPSIQSMVRADLTERERVGIERYGTPLQAHNGRDALVDAYQEAMDLTLYLRQALVERHTATCECPDKLEPPGDGSGWDRATIDRIIADAHSGGIPPEYMLAPEDAGQVKALLADRDLAHRQAAQRWRLAIDRRKERDAAHAELTEAIAERDTARNNLHLVVEDHRRLSTEMTQMTAQRDRMCHEWSAADAIAQSYGTRLDQCHQAMTATQQQLDVARTELEQADNSIRQYGATVKQLRIELTEVTAERDSARAVAQDAITEIDRLRELVRQRDEDHAQGGGPSDQGPV